MKISFQRQADLWSPGFLRWVRWTGARFTGLVIGNFIIGRVVCTK